jgi:3-dehydroquinate synthase
VAIGMVQEAGIAQSLGLCTADVVARQRELVRRAGLPHELPPVRFAELWDAMQHDKKVARGRLYCVLPEQVGRVVIAPLERGEVSRWFAGCSQRRRPHRR